MATNVLSNAASNYKTSKSIKSGVYDGRILYLAPARESGIGNVCPFASQGCMNSCLYTAGRGKFSTVKQGRIRKTILFYTQKKLFFETLHKEVTSLVTSCEKSGKIPFVRLNGTSDIDYSRFNVYNTKNIFEEFPSVVWYDYTKSINKVLNNKYKNYHLTFSRSETNHADVLRALAANINVAVVFAGKKLPKKYLGKPVINGDKTDLRFLEGYRGAIIGLTAKGKARKDKTGFVVNA